MASEPARIGDRLLIREKLGGSGIATSFRAFDTELHQWRCLKVLRPRYGDRRRFMKRFREEVHVLALLNHAHIVRIYEASNDGERAWVLMEMCESGSVKDWVEAHGPMPPRLACDVVLAAADGVEHAHDMGVVHGAIKPANLLIAGGGMIRVSDFGINRLKQVDLKHGSVVGQVSFIGPEARSNAAKADVRSDVYALGATLHYLMTGRAMADLYLMDPEQERGLGVPQTVTVFLKKAVAFEPKRRQQTVQQFINELRMLRAGLPADPADVAPLTREFGTPAPPEPLTHLDLLVDDPDAAATLIPDSVTVSALLDALSERPVDDLKDGVLEEEDDADVTEDTSPFAGAIAQRAGKPSAAPAWETVFPESWNPLDELDVDREAIAAQLDGQAERAVDELPDDAVEIEEDDATPIAHGRFVEPPRAREAAEPPPFVVPLSRAPAVPPPRGWSSPPPPPRRWDTPSRVAAWTPPPPVTPAPVPWNGPREADGSLSYTEPVPPPPPPPVHSDEVPEIVAVPTLTPAPTRIREATPSLSPRPSPVPQEDPDDEDSDITDVIPAEPPATIERVLTSSWTAALVLLISAACMIVAARFYLDVHVAKEVERARQEEPPPPSGKLIPE